MNKLNFVQNYIILLLVQLIYLSSVISKDAPKKNKQIQDIHHQASASDPIQQFQTSNFEDRAGYRHNTNSNNGNKDYKKKKFVKKSKSGKYGKAKDNIQHGDLVGAKSNKVDELGKYDKHHKLETLKKGAKFSEKEGHKKGHKTKGYHNKFYKDVYENEHKIYDVDRKDDIKADKQAQPVQQVQESYNLQQQNSAPVQRYSTLPKYILNQELYGGNPLGRFGIAPKPKSGVFWFG